jgi:hypothetical protein
MFYSQEDAESDSEIGRVSEPLATLKSSLPGSRLFLAPTSSGLCATTCSLTWAQCYKTFYVCNLRVFVIS